MARIYEPGAKADHCLILEGPQGLLKSTALNTIAGRWFTDEIAELGSKDAAMQTRGVWIIEIAELDSMTRADVSKVKAFMSRACDRFRPPYGRRLIESPRQCVFAGTVNQSTYLRDDTGARRFWPVTCTRILIDDLARDRDQLWAEAVVRYRSGSPWWLNSRELNREAEQEQAARYVGDPWGELIAGWLKDPTRRFDGAIPISPFISSTDSVSISDILLHCIGKRQEQWTQAGQNRVAACLRTSGWERYRDRTKNMEWCYRRKKIMMFPVCSHSCFQLCSHSNPFLFIRVPSVPSMSRVRLYRVYRVSMDAGLCAQHKYRNRLGTLGTGDTLSAKGIEIINGPMGMQSEWINSKHADAVAGESQ